MRSNLHTNDIRDTLTKVQEQNWKVRWMKYLYPIVPIIVISLFWGDFIKNGFTEIEWTFAGVAIFAILYGQRKMSKMVTVKVSGNTICLINYNKNETIQISDVISLAEDIGDQSGYIIKMKYLSKGIEKSVFLYGV